MDDATHDRAWSPVATDLATVARLLDDVSYPVHLTAVGDDDHVMVAANRATLELLGRTWEEVCGRPLGEVITDSGALATMRRRRDQAVDTLAPVFHEFGIDLPEGPRRYEATLVPVTDGNGGCTHVFGVWRDATSERERMREAEARSRAILDATPDVLVTVHRDGTILTIDGSIRQVLDDADGIVGQRITDLHQSDLTDRVMRLVTDALDTGDLHVDEMVVDIAGLE
ncbi:MAG TPA: PAS domain-containing protein, partial [Acidimicrobiia bacterium]|nr:PAS domain-containing protein [Acidimicrobiia bacterium]